MLARSITILFLALIAVGIAGCRKDAVLEPVPIVSAISASPKTLWAWERPEDLRFIAGKNIGVAFLAQTLYITGGEITVRPRRQPLQVDPQTSLTAVTRIEVDRSSKPDLSPAQMEKLVERAAQTLKLKNVSAVQIDFDAAVSERDFYRKLMTKLRERIPAETTLMMTALASWCRAPGWLKDMPVAEAIPMAFRMGADDASIRSFLGAGKDWGEPLCQKSYGFSLDEQFDRKLVPGRSIYLFNDRPWKESDLPLIESFN